MPEQQLRYRAARDRGRCGSCESVAGPRYAGEVLLTVEPAGRRRTDPRVPNSRSSAANRVPRRAAYRAVCSSGLTLVFAPSATTTR